MHLPDTRVLIDEEVWDFGDVTVNVKVFGERYKSWILSDKFGRHIVAEFERPDTGYVETVSSREYGREDKMCSIEKQKNDIRDEVDSCLTEISELKQRLG